MSDSARLTDASTASGTGLRVLHVTQSLSGGLGRYVVDLARHQLREGLEVMIACPSGCEPVAADATGLRRLSWEVTGRPTTALPREIAVLRRLARRERPHVVHLHSSKAGVAGRLGLSRRYPVIFQPHAWSFEADDGILGVAAKCWERGASGLADAIVCVSQGERRRGIAAGISGARLVHVPNGVDLARHTEVDAATRAAERGRRGLDEQRVVLFVGRLHRQKGVDVLLAAWPRVRREVPDARLVLVGDGPDRARVEAAADERTRVVGFTADPGGWLATADVVAIPSRWEGHSLVLLEAMARGCCIVGTRVDGTRESLADGRGGLVPVADPDALADAVVTRLRDPALRRREGAAARRHVEDHHDLADGYARISRLYREVTA